MTASSTPSPGFGPLVQVSPSRNGIVQRGGQADTAVVPACRVRSRIFIGPPSRISVPHPDSPRNGTKGQQAARREDGRLLVDAAGVRPPLAMAWAPLYFSRGGSVFLSEGAWEQA